MAEAAAAYKEASKEGDEAGKALFGETEDEAEDNAGSDESPPDSGSPTPSRLPRLVVPQRTHRRPTVS